MNKFQAFRRAGVASVYKRASVAHIVFNSISRLISFKSRESMRIPLLIALVLHLGIASSAQAEDPRNAMPDLTNGGDQYADPAFPGDNRYNDVHTWNLGPTGLAGWMYRYDWFQKYAGWNTELARQIEVQTVDPGSPADGIMQVGDVILGADGTGTTPVSFSSDARKAFASAIADAEARTPAELKLLVWRAGSTSVETLTLETLGAYSATAPYNCPKSAAILEKGLDAVMASGGTDAYKMSLLVLLAGNDPSNPDNAARMARAQQEAHQLILSQADIDLYTSDVSLTYSKVAWDLGFKLTALAEYYLHTGDAAVYDSLRAYAIACANGQSMFGTSGHQFALQGEDGSLNGPYGVGYGVVNSANMQCFYGLTLAREAGVTDQKILDAIERAARFYGGYVDRGSIPYGEHSPGMGHGDNGKNGIGAICMKMVGNRNYDANYYAMLAGASVDNLDAGHQGPYLNYLWAPLGANMGGEAAMAAFFAEMKWQLDLARNWDGTFTYNSYQNGGQYGYGGSTWSGSGLQMYMACLLPYAAPLREIYATGKGNDNPAEWLTAAEIADVQLSSGYDASGRTTNELMGDLGSWSPFTRMAAAQEIGLRTSEHAALLPTLEAMVTDTNEALYLRMGACRAIGEIGNDASVPLMVGLLSDSNDLIRYAAAEALPNFSAAAKRAELNAIMAACVAASKPLLPLDEDDPVHITHMEISAALLDPWSGGILRNYDLSGVDRELLYPTLRSILKHPMGAVRGWVAQIYPNLNKADLEALADVVVDSTLYEAPADRMFSGAVRSGGLDLLQTYNIAEGVPIAKKIYFDGIVDALTTLQSYAGSSETVVPDAKITEWCLAMIAKSERVTESQAILDAIAADPNPEAVEPFKGFYQVIADDAALTVPADRTTLRAYAYDYAKGDSVFTWRKVHGAGEVTFVDNGTSTADQTLVVFDGTPGQYLFEVTMSDSRDLTEVTETVAVTLYDTGGTLPSNGGPTANPQSITVDAGTPTQIILDSADPEGYALTYTITSGPSHGQLSGTGSSLLYTAAADYSGTDSFTYEVTDSEGQVTTGTVSITITAASPVGLAIYEPFDYPAGELNGTSGTTEIGLDGAWFFDHTQTNSQIFLQAPNFTFGTLPTTGLHVYSTGVNLPGFSRQINPSALAGRGLLDDGATLWFSVIVGNIDKQYDHVIQIALANASFPYLNYIVDDGADPGTGLGFTVNGKSVVATQFHDISQGVQGDAPTYGDWDPYITGHIKDNEQRLVVGKITWGASSDLIELYLPYEDMILPSEPCSTLIANVDQSKFDTLTFSRGRDLVIDEFRFGATLQSVLQGTVDMTTDVTAPTPDPMSFAVAPTAGQGTSITMVATTAYDPVGVEYYFTCTAGGGNDSGWQSSNVYTDTGLTPGVQYSYTVKARDTSPAMNETAASSVASATVSLQGTIPNVVEMAQATAESRVITAGMTLGSVTQATNYSLTVPAGHVLSQTPSGPTSAAYGTLVDLEISIGENPAWPTINSVDIVDDQLGGPVILPRSILYTLTFSESMDVSSIDAGDFFNFTGYPIAIGAINQTSPGVVTVEVTPTGSVDGTILFGIAQGAIILNAQGDSLNTSSAIVDDTLVSVIAVVNDPPVWLSDPVVDRDAREDTAYLSTLTDDVNDPDGNPLTFAKVSGPAWLSVAADGTLSGTPGSADIGSNVFTVSVTDDIIVNPIEVTLNITVLDSSTFNPIAYYPFDSDYTDASGSGNHGTLVDVGTSGNSGITNTAGEHMFGGGALNLSSERDFVSVPIGSLVSDLDGWAIVFWTKDADAINNNGGMAIGDESNSTDFIWVDSSLSFRVRTSNNSNASFGITTEDTLWHHHAIVVEDYDNDGSADDVTLYRDGVYVGTVLNAAGTGFNLTSIGSAYTAVYDYDFHGQIDEVYVYDTAIGAATVAELYAGAPNTTAPTLASIVDDRSGNPAEVGNLIVYTFTFNEDMDASTVDASDFSNAGTSNITIGTITETSPGVFTLEVTATDAGSLQVQVSAAAVLTDVAGNALDTTSAIVDDTTITISVSAGNIAPVFSADPITGTDATQDAAYSGTIAGSATDANSDPLIYAKVSGPAWLSVAGDGALSGTPGSADVGANVFTVSVTDSIAAPVNATLNITVNSTANNPPVWTVDPVNEVNATENSVYTSTLADDASDPDSDPLTYAKVSGPAWLSVAADGTLSGTPSNADVGANVFTVSVTDGIITSPLEATLNITVNPAAPQSAAFLFDFQNDLTTDIATGAVAVNDLSSPVNANGLTLTATVGNAMGNSRDRGANSGPNSDITRDFIQWPIAGPITITISGLAADQEYAFKVWSGDMAANQIKTTDHSIAGASGGGTIQHTSVSVAEENATGGSLIVFPNVISTGAGTLTYTIDYVIGGGTAATLNGFELTAIGGDTTPPTLASTDMVDDQAGANVTENDLVTYTLTFSEDIDEATVDATDFGNAGTAAVTIGTITETSPGVFTVEVTPTTAGSLQLQVSAAAVITDLAGNALDTTSAIVDDTIITVDEANVAPVWAADPVNEVDATEDSAYSATLANDASDGNAGDSLTYAKVSGPAWLSVAANGDLSGTPGNADVGANAFTVSVTDGIIATPIEATLNITVLNTNDAPVYTADPIGGSAATEDLAYSGSISGSATDVDTGASLTYAKVSGPAWLSVATNGDLTGTPLNADVGANAFTVSVTDGIIATPIEATLNITVLNTNDAPFWTSNPVNEVDATEDAAYSSSLAGDAIDVDTGASLTFAKVSGPAWLSVAANGVLSGTPTNSDVGANAFTVSVSDGIATAVEATLNITVINTNDAPVFTADPISGVVATEDTLYSATIAGSATDMDAGASLTYAKVSGPSWLSVATDGTLSGTPTNADVSANSFTVSVTDGIAPAVEATLNITVIDTNDAPVFTVDPIIGSDAIEDAAYVGSISGSATDEDVGASLIYAKVSGPAWLSVAANGDLSGTPTNADVGANSFTVSVTDGIVATPVEATLNIAVINTNDAPIFTLDPISGSDATEDAPYSSTITGSATDDDGDTLTYAKVSGPAWLSIAGDGTLSGTPANADLGLNTFTISVSDSIAPAVNASLEISVNSAATPGVITYVDAVDGSGGNTYTSGSAPGGTATGWVERTVFGNGGVVYQGGYNTDSSEITTEVTGLADGSYDVWVFFWDASGSNTWSIAAGLTSGSLTTYSHDGPGDTISPQAASSLTFDVVPVVAESDRILYGVYLGQSTVAAGSALRVFVDDHLPINANTRTWYDGIGYSPVAGGGNNAAPTWNVDPIEEIDATEDSAYTGTLADDASDADSDPLYFTKVSGPGWLNVATDGTLSGTPTTAEVGTNFFTVSVTDNIITTPVEATLNITVVNMNRAPDFTLNPIDRSDATEDALYSDTIAGSATDEDGDSLTYAMVSGPAWLNVASDGTLSGTPAATDVGLNVFTVDVSDGIAASVQATLEINVNAAPSPSKLLRTTLSAVSSDSWQTVDLGQPYNSAVIVATPVIPNNSHPPVVTRVRNVNGGTFDIKIERVDGQSGAVAVDVHVVAVEERVYTLAEDGVIMEAVKYTSTITSRKNSWTGESRSYQNSYTNPVVVGQVMSSNDTNWSVFWCQGSARTSPPDSSNLSTGKHVGEDPNGTRGNETIGYIVIESGSWSLNNINLIAGLGSDSVQGPGNSTSGYTYTLNGLNSATAAAVSLAGMDGADGGFAVLAGLNSLTTTSIRLYADEDTLGDSERSHTTEQVGYLIME